MKLAEPIPENLSCYFQTAVLLTECCYSFADAMLAAHPTVSYHYFHHIVEPLIASWSFEALRLRYLVDSLILLGFQHGFLDSPSTRAPRKNNPKSLIVPQNKLSMTRSVLRLKLSRTLLNTFHLLNQLIF